MTVKQLIKALSKLDEKSTVLLTQKDGTGWDNIGRIVNTESSVLIIMDGKGLMSHRL